MNSGHLPFFTFARKCHTYCFISQIPTDAFNLSLTLNASIAIVPALLITALNQGYQLPEKLAKSHNQNGVATLLIPGSEAVSHERLFNAVQQQINSLQQNEEIKGIIFTGKDNSFCCCSSLGNEDLYDTSRLSSMGQKLMFNIESLGKPTITAISGTCSGIGLELALASDFIIAADSTRFGFTGICNGILPFCGGTQRLARLIGKSKAKELIFSGETIDAGEAFRIGLINRLYREDALQTEAEALMQKICSRSSFALKIAGEVINAGYDIDLKTACLLERDAFALIFSSHDQREGMQAFLEKRQPSFGSTALKDKR